MALNFCLYSIYVIVTSNNFTKKTDKCYKMVNLWFLHFFKGNRKLFYMSDLQSINDRDGADESWSNGQALTEGVLNNLCASDGPTWTII